MPNKKYIRGRAYEYKAKRVLEEQGYTVIRASGSHGKWDLMAVQEEEPDRPVRCIQIKVTKSELGLNRLLKAFKAESSTEAPFHWQYELWVHFKGKWHIAK